MRFELKVCLITVLATIVSVSTSWANAYGDLMVAIYQDDSIKVKKAIQAGANVNQHDKNNFDNTPLLVAIDEGNTIEIINLLINAGANVNAKDKWGNTAILGIPWGSNKSTRIADILLKAGANPNVADMDGTTPLMKAVTFGYPIDVEM